MHRQRRNAIRGSLSHSPSRRQTTVEATRTRLGRHGDIRRRLVRYGATAQIVRLVRRGCRQAHDAGIAANILRIVRRRGIRGAVKGRKWRIAAAHNQLILISALHELSRRTAEIPDLSVRTNRLIPRVLESALYWTKDGGLIGNAPSKPLVGANPKDEIRMFWEAFERQEGSRPPVTYVRGAMLPTRERGKQSALRFAVTACPPNGETSDGWTVWTEREGDVYLAARTGTPGLKASLHASGCAHIKTAAVDLMGTWSFSVPSVTDLARPTLKLCFPSWSLTVRHRDRRVEDNRWKRNAVLIVGSRSMLMTIVSLTSVPTGMNFNMPDPSMTLIRRIPARSGAEVAVTAHQESSIGLHQVVVRALNEIRFVDPSGRDLQISLCHASSGRIPTHRLALQGPSGPFGQYLVVVSVAIEGVNRAGMTEDQLR